MITTIDPEIAAQHAAIDAAAAKRKDYEVRLGYLERQVQDSQGELNRAEERKEFFVKRISELEQLLLGIWGKEKTVVNVDPVTSSIDAYNSILTMTKAVDDFPRVQRHLAQRLAAARKERDEFTRRK